MPDLSSKLFKKLESLLFAISVTFSQISQIEKAVALDTSQLELLQATNAFTFHFMNFAKLN